MSQLTYLSSQPDYKLISPSGTQSKDIGKDSKFDAY